MCSYYLSNGDGTIYAVLASTNACVNYLKGRGKSVITWRRCFFELNLLVPIFLVHITIDLLRSNTLLSENVGGK